MYAIIQSGGKQYRVSPGDEIRIEKIEGSPGDRVTFDRVLLTSNGEKVEAGKPYLEGVTVTGRLTARGKARKVMVFKYKRRKGYRRTRGHRQQYCLVRIEGIETG
ncbi:MAG: 50S ribosomal protein L21 [Deltaproteobacteria bacterium]|nr:50S ribosomal protein L21 [Deltaproteobacteria bacterium]